MRYLFLGEVSVKNAKQSLDHFLNGPNRTKVDNMKNAKILAYSVKVAYLDTQNGKN